MGTVETKSFDYGKKEMAYLASADPVLGAAIAELGKIEREVIPDLFAALVYAVISQLVSVRSANTIWSRMQVSIGDITPERIASVSTDDIQRFGMTLKKAAVISALSKDTVQGRISLDRLSEMSDEEVIRYLTAWKGIGPWTAEMLLINGMERPDVVSWGDIAIRRGMQRLYGLPKLTKGQFDMYKGRYSPYGSVASIYLWQLSL